MDRTVRISGTARAAGHGGNVSTLVGTADFDTHRHTLTRTRERQQVLRGTRKAKKRCILSIKIKKTRKTACFSKEKGC
jgi:hypothetical protein